MLYMNCFSFFFFEITRIAKRKGEQTIKTAS